MSAATVVFLIIGGIGVGVLALALLGVEFVDLGGDVDGPVSLEAVAGFLGAFGFAAAIASEVLDAGSAGAIAAAAGVGTLAAIPTGYAALRLARAARNMPTDATPTRADVVGTLGVVVTPIPASGYGEVRIRLGGQPVKLNARAAAAIPAGAQVFVIEAPSDTSVVVEQTPAVH